MANIHCRAAVRLALLALGTTAHAHEAVTATKKVSFDINAPSMMQALIQFTEQSGLQLALPTEGATDIPAHRVTGLYTPVAALEQLLAGSGLRYEFANERTVAIRIAQAAQVAASDELEEVVVTSKIVFTQNDAFGATKMGLSLKDTPQTVAVVTKDLIQASGMGTFSDFYKVDASSGALHNVDVYPQNFYRGFLVASVIGRSPIRVDGFRMLGAINLDFATLDRFEVVKGPTSTLYGQNSIGGMLNAVSKLPQHRFGADFALEGGQFNAYRLDADVTGPLGSSDAWSYRLIGAYSDADSFIDFVSTRVKVLSSSIQYEPSTQTRLTVRATWQATDSRASFGPNLQLAGSGTGTMIERMATEGLKVADIPRSRYFGMPWNYEDVEAKFLQAQGEHTFTNDWRLRASAQFSKVDLVNDSFASRGPVDENGFSYASYAYGTDAADDVYGAEVNLFGKVQLFGREHTLFFGADYHHFNHDSRGGFQSLSYGYGNSLFNAFHPDYSAVQPFSMSDYAYRFDSNDENNSYGATVQLILSPADRVKVLLGGRYSVDALFLQKRDGNPDTIDDQGFATFADVDFHSFTAQTGLTYELTDAVSLYASFGQTFEPVTKQVFVGEGLPGKLIDPEKGISYEIGAKMDWSRDLSLSMAAFQMERTNIAQRDFDHQSYSLPIGTQRSRGVELGAQGRLSPPLSIYASVAYLDAEFSEGEFKGLQAPGAPRFGVSAFGTYEILDGSLKGLGFGLGAVYKSGLKTFDAASVPASGSPVTFDFGSFTEVDARVFYGRDRWSITLSASNLFNEEYYSPRAAYFGGGQHVNPPRAFKVGARYKF